MKVTGYDFGGYITKNNIKCTDGRTIRKDAFAAQDGETIPLVWHHMHDKPGNVIGHAVLENRADGVYGYCFLNNTQNGKDAKEVVRNGDLDAMSIFANRLVQHGKDVLHGDLVEASLVLRGANKGAKIDKLTVAHAAGYGYDSEDDADDDLFDEAIINFWEKIDLAHSADDEDDISEEEDESSENEEDDVLEHADDKTLPQILETLNPEQQVAVEYVINQLMEQQGNSIEHSDEGGETMKYNAFDTNGDPVMQGVVLTHAQMSEIIQDQSFGSLKASFLAHAQDYGVDPVEILFPDAREMNTPPEFYSRNMDWVSDVMDGAHHTPYSRVKTTFADITADEARAKGYIKGRRKKEEFFTLLRRTTEPQTIYKKQKLDKDDIDDITSFDIVAWIRGEMRIMLNEEIARAILIGDGRSTASEDKIKEDKIRPIVNDDSLYSVKYTVNVPNGADEDVKAKAFIKACIKSRKNYKGSGNPTLFTTEDMLTSCLLLTDEMGRDLYDTEEKLRTKLRVAKIVTVEPMEGFQRTDNGKLFDVAGIIVNMKDYNIGADHGGQVNMFDDFDIDYNQYKYLLETRISGALVKLQSALVLQFAAGDAPVDDDIDDLDAEVDETFA